MSNQNAAPVTLTRKELYDQVWATPMVELAKKYHVRNSLLARICDTHNVPRPGAGYWSSKRGGWAPDPPPLPPAESPASETVTIDPAGVPTLAAPTRHASDDEVNRLIGEEMARPPIRVPKSLQSLHPLIATGAANLSAPKTLLPRAQRIMNTVFRELEARGHQVIDKSEGYKRVTLVKVLGETFDIRLYEPMDWEPHTMTPEEEQSRARWGYSTARKFDREPSGRLCLQLRSEGAAFVHSQVRDTDTQAVEDRLGRFIISILRRVDHERKLRAERDRREQVRREAGRKQQEAEAQKRRAEEEQKREQARVDTLLEQVRRWKQAGELREYLEEARRIVRVRGFRITPGGEFESWLGWATGVADRLDPFQKLRHGQPSK